MHCSREAIPFLFLRENNFDFFFSLGLIPNALLNGISNFRGYLMSKPFLLKNSSGTI